MEVPAGAERRGEPRYQVSHEFVVSHPGMPDMHCLSENLSLSGVFFVGDFSEFTVGSTVEVSFTRMSRRQDISKSTRFHLKATIIRITELGAGMRFLGNTMEVDAALFDLMHRDA